MLEGPPDRVLVYLDLVRLAPDTRVERLAVALDPARDGGPECLAGVGVPVASDVPGQAAAARGAGEQAAATPDRAGIAAVWAMIRSPGLTSSTTTSSLPPCAVTRSVVPRSATSGSPVT